MMKPLSIGSGLFLSFLTAVTPLPAQDSSEAEAAASPSSAAPVFSQEYRTALQDADGLFRQKKFQETLAKLDEADKIQPDQVVSLNMRGAVHTEIGEYDKAVALFNKVLEKSPNFFPAQFNLGEILFQQGKYTEARDHFTKLLEAHPQQNEIIGFKLTLIAIRAHDRAAAEKWAESIPFMGNTPAYYYAKAALEFDQKNADKGISWLQSSFGIFPAVHQSFFLQSLEDMKWIARSAVQTDNGEQLNIEVLESAGGQPVTAAQE